MIMKKLIVAVIACATIGSACAQGCLPEGITFTTQEQIDNFQTNYPGCTEIEGDVIINDGFGSDNITNLSGISVLTSIDGSLYIDKNHSLPNLTGLDNLTNIGGSLSIGSYDQMGGGNSLTSLTGLENITSIAGDFIIVNNNSLLSLTGLDNLTHIDGNLDLNQNNSITSISALGNLAYIGGGFNLGIPNNLTTLAGLENLEMIEGGFTISGGYSLTSLTGLEGLISIGGGFTLWESDALDNLMGLDNLTNIGGNFNIMYCNSLDSLKGLEGLTSIGGELNIGINDSLTSLSAINNIDAGSITNLYIAFNNLLSNCEIQSICEYLLSPNGTVNITNNAPGCNSQAEVEDACGIIGVEEISHKSGFSIYPNPSTSQITIETSAMNIPGQLSIFNLNGQQLMQRLVAKPVTVVDISHLPAGVYLVKLQNDKTVIVEKLIKE
jgi:hypothetical protein